MKSKRYRLNWSINAVEQFEEILQYILRDSIEGEAIVRDAVLSRVDQLTYYPFMYEPDFLKDQNDGSFRAFTVYSYRITYWVGEKEIIVIRIKHTSREPEMY